MVWKFAKSPLEQLFWHHVLLRCFGNFRDNYEPQKKFGRFRVDAFFSLPGVNVVVELDGKQYHDPAKDFKRDSWILKNSIVDEIIRIPYPALWYYRDATMRVLEEWHPQFHIASSGLFSREEWMKEMSIVADDISNSVSLDWSTLDEFLDWAESNYDVWHTEKHRGYAQGPKGFIKHWKSDPITRRFKA